jgi:hypothetical protein
MGQNFVPATKTPFLAPPSRATPLYFPKAVPSQSSARETSGLSYFAQITDRQRRKRINNRYAILEGSVFDSS